MIVRLLTIVSFLLTVLLAQGPAVAAGAAFVVGPETGPEARYQVRLVPEAVSVPFPVPVSVQDPVPVSVQDPASQVKQAPHVDMVDRNRGVPDEDVYFITFTRFQETHRETGREYFRQLVKATKEVRRDHKIYMNFFSVVCCDAAEDKADIITFGYAHSYDRLQGYLDDERLKKSYPELRTKLSKQLVTVIDGPLHSSKGGDLLLLRQAWLKSPRYKEKDWLENLNRKLLEKRKRFRVRYLGIADGIVNVTGPVGREHERPEAVAHKMELFSFGNAKGFFRDSQVKMVEEIRGNMLEKTNDFWLVPLFSGGEGWDVEPPELPVLPRQPRPYQKEKRIEEGIEGWERDK